MKIPNEILYSPEYGGEVDDAEMQRLKAEYERTLKNNIGFVRANIQLDAKKAINPKYFEFQRDQGVYFDDARYNG